MLPRFFIGQRLYSWIRADCNDAACFTFVSVNFQLGRLVTIPSQPVLLSPLCASIALLIRLSLDRRRASLSSNLPGMGARRNTCDKKSLLKKRRRGSIIAFEMIRLDRDADEPLHQQLYRQIRDELKS